MAATILASVHTAVTGWDVLWALVVVVVVWLLSRVITEVPWWRAVTLFAAALLVFALLFTF